MGIKVLKDGGIIIHPNIASDSVQIPQTDTVEGAGFGDTITDVDRKFASEREPVGWLLTYGVSADVTEKWFTINDPDTEEADPALDRLVQDALNELKFKKRLTEALEAERVYGWSLLVGGFTDAQNVEGLRKELGKRAELKQLSMYPKTNVQVWLKDENPVSPRFGEALVYKLDRGSGASLLVHYTRTVMVKTRSNGLSVLDPVWDDLCCGRNIRWGAAQWMYRNGGGFPVIGFPAGTSLAQLEEYANSGAFRDLMSRTYICIAQNETNQNNGMTFDFVGSAGRALDPQPFFQTNDEQISKGSGIPQPKLVGAQAGAVTGSEYNQQDYYKMISRVQAGLEDVVRWVIGHLADSGQLSLIQSASDSKLKAMLKRVFTGDYRHKTAKTYTIEWNSAFELSEKDQALIELQKAQASQIKLGWMSKDEVRAENNLDPLPDGEGASVQQPGLNLFGGKEQNTQLQQGDKFLVVDLSGKKDHEHSGKSSQSGSSGSGQTVDS